jgi:hypothetical protein
MFHGLVMGVHLMHFMSGMLCMFLMTGMSRMRFVFVPIRAICLHFMGRVIHVVFVLARRTMAGRMILIHCCPFSSSQRYI